MVAELLCSLIQSFRNEGEQRETSWSLGVKFWDDILLEGKTNLLHPFEATAMYYVLFKYIRRSYVAMFVKSELRIDFDSYHQLRVGRRP